MCRIKDGRVVVDVFKSDCDGGELGDGGGGGGGEPKRIRLCLSKAEVHSLLSPLRSWGCLELALEAAEPKLAVLICTSKACLLWTWIFVLTVNGFQGCFYTEVLASGSFSRCSPSVTQEQ